MNIGLSSLLGIEKVTNLSSEKGNGKVAGTGGGQRGGVRRAKYEATRSGHIDGGVSTQAQKDLNAREERLGNHYERNGRRDVVHHTSDDIAHHLKAIFFPTEFITRNPL